MKKNFYAGVPKSYKHLLQFVQAYTEQPKCDCEEWHLTTFGKVVFTACLLSLVSSFALISARIFVSGDHSFGTWSIIVLTNTALLASRLPSLSKQGWMYAHPDKVITDLIPTYIHTQINYMETSLVGSGSRIELAEQEVLKVIVKGEETEEFVRQFGSGLPADKELPDHLVKMAKVGQHCLLFNEVYNSLRKSKRLVKTRFANIREEVDLFKKSLRASVEKNQSYGFAQKICLVQAKTICDSLNILSLRFNGCLDESGVSTFGSAAELSEDAEVSVNSSSYAANNLLQKLTELYGVKTDESKVVLAKLKEESPKPDESKISEPSVEGSGLTEADLQELAELDLKNLKWK